MIKQSLTILALASMAMADPLPAPWSSQDLGNPKTAGTAKFADGKLTVTASGKDIYADTDHFHFVHQPMEGDGQIVAKLISSSKTNIWSKAGVMIREAIDESSKHAMMIVTGGSGTGQPHATSFQQRIATRGETTLSGPQGCNAPIWIRVARTGNKFEGFTSSDGKHWISSGSVEIKMRKEVFVGICLTSHDDDMVNTSVFSDIKIGDVPPPPPPAPAPEPVKLDHTGWIPMMTGRNFDNWYTFIGDKGKNKDPEGVLKINNEGMVHLLDLADTSKRQEFGYFATNDEYKNYRLRFQYRWGQKKYAPRANVQRDSGLLYHMKKEDKVWPCCVECQVQERDTGDFFILSGPKIDATVKPGSNVYMPAGEVRANSNGKVTRNEILDHMTDWNTVEAIITEDEGIHIVNGKVNNAGFNFSLDGQPLTQGKIALQVEGAEIFYKDIEIQPLATIGGTDPYKVLVFSKTKGFRHKNIPDGIKAVKALGARNNFSVDATEDSAVFTADNLKQYKAVIFLNTTGDILDDTQQTAFEGYIKNGGGFVGIHSASDTEYHWAWYGRLVGTYFNGHPSVQDAEIIIEDPNHPSTSSIGSPWNRKDEWYDFKASPREQVKVLASLTPTSYKGTKMKEDHPISWYQHFDGGRSWYTGMGHTSETFEEPLFLIHLLGGIEWAAGTSSAPADGATVLFDGKDLSQWQKMDGKPAEWNLVDDGSMQGAKGPIITREKYQDFKLHLEFRPNSTKPGTGEQGRGNSGVYLQGRYEVQVLDSFNHPLEGTNDCAAIYSIANATSNQALPPDSWQSYDIEFRAAKYEGDKKVKDAEVTVWWNGVKVHDNVKLPKATTAAHYKEGPEAGPIYLQDHGNPVRYRNIWIQPLK